MIYEYRTTFDEIVTSSSPGETWRHEDIFNEYWMPDPKVPEGEGWELVGTAVAALHYQNVIVWTWRRKQKTAGKRTKVKK
jgi:hypothetical protein